MGYGLNIPQNFAEYPHPPDQYAHGFRLPVGELTTEAGLIGGDLAGFLTRFKLWIIIHNNIRIALFRSAPALTLRFEFRLNRKAGRSLCKILHKLNQALESAPFTYAAPGPKPREFRSEFRPRK